MLLKKSKIIKLTQSDFKTYYIKVKSLRQYNIGVKIDTQSNGTEECPEINFHVMAFDF